MITLGEGAAALAGGKGASGAAAIAKGEAQGAKLAAKEGAAAPTPKGGTYKLIDRDTGQVRRTGRTNDLDRRAAEHRRNPSTKELKFSVDRRTSNYPAQRGREQRLYDMHPEADLNHKRPIDPTNPNRSFYLSEGDKL